MRFLKIMSWLVAVMVVVVLGAVGWLYFQTYNAKTGSIKLAGLTDEVSITWDSNGVPHINAKSSDMDAFFALGYAHASDRLWQMEFQRRVASGRLSEVLGDATVEKDKFLRTWGFYRSAEQALPALEPRSKQIIDSYTAGVNAFIKTGKLPVEFKILSYSPEPWTPTDSIAWQKMMAFDLGGNWEDEIERYQVTAKVGAEQAKQLFLDYPKDARTILSPEDIKQSKLDSPAPPQAPSTPQSLSPDHVQQLQHWAAVKDSLGFEQFSGKGSNNWVIGGSRTVSGKPILADDPHLSLSAPALWYLAELKAPNLHVIGSTIPGIPGVVIGYNERIAWGVTNVDPDVQDLFVLPQNASVTRRSEVIKVKNKPDISLTVEESSHGPVISGVSKGVAEVGQKVALKWTALQPSDTTLDAFLGVNYAQNWSEFTGALKRFIAPSQNFVYADVDGNIGYYAPGKVPLRDGWDGSVPVDGAKDWSGYIPFEKLPHVYNPPEGYIVTANEKVTPSNYAYTLGNDSSWTLPYRASRIHDLIAATPKHTVESVKAIQNDVLSGVFADFKPYLLKTSTQNPQAEKALALLKDWDGVQSEDSVASAIFGVWYSRIITMFKEETDVAYVDKPDVVLKQLAENGQFCKSTTANTCAEFLSQTLTESLSILNDRLGQDMAAWQWSKLHHMVSKHGVLGDVKALSWLFNRSTPSKGGVYTVNVAPYNFETFVQSKGPSYRQIVDLAQTSNSLYVHSLGQSGNPFSAHYSSLLALWRKGDYLPMQSVKNGSVQTLQPQ